MDRRTNRTTGPGPRALAALAAALIGLLALPQAGRSAGLLIPVGQERSMAIARQNVTVHVNNGIAVTTVDQVFRNHAPAPAEAVYRFPVPENASVSNFSLWINGTEVIGEVLEKQRARQIYREVTSTPKDPGLLEQTNFKWFEMRVSPVPANGEQRIQISYYQPVDYDAGYLVYTYPLETAGVSRTDLEGEFSVLVDVTSAIPMKQVYTPSHATELLVRQTTPQRFRAGIELAKGTLDRDFVLVCQLERERTGIDLIASRRDGDAGYFMLLVTPSTDLDRLAEPIHCVFVLDVSGSMRELGKLPLARSAVEQMLGRLRPQDRFNIVSFNIAPEALAGASLPGGQAEKDRAKTYLAGLNAAGGTDLLAALRLAAGLQLPGMRNVIVLLSDGQATTTEDHSAYLPLLAGRGAGTTVFSFGIGNDVNRPLLGALAERTGGFADYVSGQEDLDRKVRSLQTKIDSPVMADVKIDWGGAPPSQNSEMGGSGQQVELVQPDPLPNLYRGQQLVVFGRYRKSGPAKLTLTATVAGKPMTLSADLDWPAATADNPEVERMWAQRTCEAMDRRLSAREGSDADRARIVELGTRFSIVTPYTSFLVLENEAEFKRYGIERLNRERIAAERTSQQVRNAWDPSAAPQGDPVATGGDGAKPGSGGGAVEWVFIGFFATLLAAGLPGCLRRRRGA